MGSIELFCLAGDLGSFTAAAVQAGITPAAVSRTIGRLEERLQVRLFSRSTRQIRLTESGRMYYLECKQALSQLLDAELGLTGAQVEPTGTLRISIPTTLGHHYILPLLPSFRTIYPRVELDIHLSNRNVDMVAEGIDMAIRARVQPDSGLVARKLFDAELVVVATPEYLRRNGRPEVPEDLARHECIQFLLPSTGQRVPWLFRNQGEDFELLTSGGFSCSDDLLGTSTLALHDAGIVQTYRFIVKKEIADFSCVELLTAHGGRSRPFSIVYPASRHLPLRLRAFIDFIVGAVDARPDGKATGLRPPSEAKLSLTS